MIECVVVVISFAGVGSLLFIPKEDTDFIKNLPSGMNATTAPGTIWLSRDYLYTRQETIQ